TTASGTLTINAGGQASEKLSIAPVGSFSSTVRLACSIDTMLPSAGCSVSPSSVTSGPNPATATLTVQLHTAAVSLHSFANGVLQSRKPAAILLLLGLLAALILSALTRLQQRRRTSLAFAAFCLLLLGGLGGCQGGSSPLPPANQVFVVTV